MVNSKMPRLAKTQELIRNGKIVELIAQEKTVREIANDVGCSNSTVYKVARENDIEIYKRQKYSKPYKEKPAEQMKFEFPKIYRAMLIMVSLIEELVALKKKLKMPIKETNAKMAEIKKLVSGLAIS